MLLPAVSGKKLDGATDDKTPEKQEELSADEKKEEMDVDALSVLSERRKSLFEPLEPITNASGKRPSAESLLPPPDFDSSSYPKGWLIGKKRKLVNVDVVESMRRIAVQEMNRKVMFSIQSSACFLYAYTTFCCFYQRCVSSYFME